MSHKKWREEIGGDGEFFSSSAAGRDVEKNFINYSTKVCLAKRQSLPQLFPHQCFKQKASADQHEICELQKTFTKKQR
jgi:hypothetical protein